MTVSVKTDPKKLAGFLARQFESTNEVSLLVVGAGALNQAIKATIIAKTFLAAQGRSLIVLPAFANVQIGTEEKTAIRLAVQKVNA